MKASTKLFWVMCFFVLPFFLVSTTVSAQQNGGSSAEANAAAVSENFINNNPAAAASGAASIIYSPSSTTNLTDQNRQFNQAPIPQPNGVMNYFGELKNVPYTAFPVIFGVYERYRESTPDDFESWVERISVEHHFVFIQKLPPINSTTVVPWRKVPAGAQFMGEGFVKLEIPYTTSTAVTIAARKAVDNGANVVGIVNATADLQPTSSSWNIGIGSSAGFIVGPNGQVGLSGSGGTSMGSSKLNIKSFAVVQAQFWKDGPVDEKISRTGERADTNTLPVKESIPEKFEATQK